MQVSGTQRGGTLVLEVSGSLDAETAPEFDSICDGLTESASSRVMLDCANLELISSAGLRSVLSLAQGTAANGGELSVCGLTGLVAEVFEITGFARMMPVYDSLDEALAAG